MNEQRPEPEVRKNQVPTWVRVVLMALLVLVVAAAFYFNNLKIIDYLQSR